MTPQSDHASTASVPCDEGTTTRKRKFGKPPSERKLGKPIPPTWLRPKANPGELELLDELIALGAPYPVIKVFRYLCKACVRYAQPGTWVRQTTIHKATGIGKSTVRTSLSWLEDHGFVARSKELINGKDRVAIWCLWLLPSGQLDNAPIDLDGVFSRGPARSERPIRVPQIAAKSAATGASKAPLPAPENLNGVLLFESNHVNVRANDNVASPGEDEEPRTTDVLTKADPPSPQAPPAPVELPPAKVLSAEQVAAFLGELGRPQLPRFRKIIAACALNAEGLLPAEFAEFASRIGSNAPVVESAPRVAVPAAAPSIKTGSALEDLLRRVAEPGSPEQLEARAKLLAARMAEEFHDWGSENGFVPKLRLATQGKIPVKVVIKAYVKARKCGRDAKPGAIFHASINQSMGASDP